MDNLISKVPAIIDNDPAGNVAHSNGGFPMYGSDVVNVQQNALADTVALLEFYRNRLGTEDGAVGIESTRTIGGSKYECGLILSGLRYKYLNASSFNIEAGQAYFKGRVVDVPQQTVTNASGSVFWIWADGSKTIAQRSYEDAVPKDATEILTLQFGYSADRDTAPAGMNVGDHHIRYDFSRYHEAADNAIKYVDVCEDYTVIQAAGHRRKTTVEDWVKTTAYTSKTWQFHSVYYKMSADGTKLRIKGQVRLAQDQISSASETIPLFDVSDINGRLGQILGQGTEVVKPFYWYENTIATCLQGSFISSVNIGGGIWLRFDNYTAGSFNITAHLDFEIELGSPQSSVNFAANEKDLQRGDFMLDPTDPNHGV
jgi:hypothetical protein